MKINRMADEKIAPGWLFEGSNTPEFSDTDYIMGDELERIKSMPDHLSEDDLVTERENIETRAKSGSLYHYNVNWSPSLKSALREYSIVCGMDESKFRPVDPEKITKANCEVCQPKYEMFFENKLQERLAEKGVSDISNLSEKEQKEFFKEVDKSWKTKNGVVVMENDPFKIDKIADMSHMEKANWENIKKQDNMDLRPSMKGGIIPVRGGEDYNINPEIRTAHGRNSIGDEDAIKNFINSKEEDTGARLKRENEQRRDLSAKHKQWEQEKIEAIGDISAIPKGNIFPTESLNAQPGIKGKDPFGFDDIPEKTRGEKIADVNEKNRKKIQGEDKEKFEFGLERASVRRISDLFGEELEKYIGNEDN